MIIEHDGLRTQIPDVDGNWLYIDFSDDDRQFYKSIDLGKTQEPFPECSQAEREQWEEEHKPQPELESPTEESVEQPTD
jgi:hypothetical protein